MEMKTKLQLTDQEKKERRSAKIREAVERHSKEAKENGKSQFKTFIDKDTLERLKL